MEETDTHTPSMSMTKDSLRNKLCTTEKKGQVTYIAPLQPTTLASVKTWGIHQELIV